VYEGKWRIFCNWCKERAADPCKADAKLVADFLCSLHKRNLVYGTIEVTEQQLVTL
jgi:hypothetical protein